MSIRNSNRNYRLEYSERRGLFHFDLGTHVKNSHGWITICDTISSQQATEFVDLIDDNYPLAINSKSDNSDNYPSLKTIKEEFVKFLLTNPKTQEIESVLTAKKYSIKDQQCFLIESIKNELKKKDKYTTPSSFFHSVWFQPISGRFLYGDVFIKYGVVEPLIESEKLVFKGYENHQGEKMLRYILAK